MYCFDNKYIKNKSTILAGVDEVGRGPLAGPVVCPWIEPSNNKLKIKRIIGITEKRDYLMKANVTIFMWKHTGRYQIDIPPLFHASLSDSGST